MKNNLLITSNLINEIEEIAYQNSLTSILTSSLAQIDSLVNSNNVIFSHNKEMKRYATALKSKGIHLLIGKFYNYHFPYVNTTNGTGKKNLRKNNNILCALLAPNNPKDDYVYASYLNQYCMLDLKKEHPEFSLLFSPDFSFQANTELGKSPFCVTGEQVRLAKFSTYSNPANRVLTRPVALDGVLKDFIVPTEALHCSQQDFLSYSSERKKIWNILQKVNSQNINVVHGYFTFFLQHHNRSLLHLELQILTTCFCSGREHQGKGNNSLFSSPFESIDVLRSQYVPLYSKLKNECLKLEKIISFIETEFTPCDRNL